MSIKLYMDVHVRRAVTAGLRLRGVDVVTAQEDNAARMPDDQLLRRASRLDRVLFSQDDDLLSEAASCQKSGERFAGVIYAHQLRISIGQCIEDLSLIAEIGEPEDLADRVEYLLLRLHCYSACSVMTQGATTGRGFTRYPPIRSFPTSGCKTFGTSIVPSACW